MKLHHLVVVLLVFAAFGCTPKKEEENSPITSGAPKDPNALKELKSETITPGTGYAAQKGDTLVMTYTGKLKAGLVFDSNDKPDGNPFSFELGAGRVIKGWDEGLVGIKKGEKRKLSVPSEKGYGMQSQDKIPSNSDLFFDVTCLEIIKKGEEQQVVIESDTPGSGPALEYGDTVYVAYTLKLANGKLIDDIRPVDDVHFRLGQKEVLAAIDIVLQKKGRVGSRIKMMLPPQLSQGGGHEKMPALTPVYIDLTVLRKVKGPA